MAGLGAGLGAVAKGLREASTLVVTRSLTVPPIVQPVSER